MKQISIKKNFLMNALLSLSNALFPLVTYFYVARILLTVGMGKVTFATSLVVWFSMFAQLGIPEYGVRAAAKARDSREELTAAVMEMAGKIMEKGPVALMMAKIAVNIGAGTDINTGLMLERLAQTIALSTEDRKEGTAAFLEKRKPVFRGR